MNNIACNKCRFCFKNTIGGQFDHRVLFIRRLLLTEKEYFAFIERL